MSEKRGQPKSAKRTSREARVARSGFDYPKSIPDHPKPWVVATLTPCDAADCRQSSASWQQARSAGYRPDRGGSREEWTTYPTLERAVGMKLGIAYGASPMATEPP